MITAQEGIYEYVLEKTIARSQLCPVCKSEIGLMPGSRDATCRNCGYKDPCCE